MSCKHKANSRRLSKDPAPPPALQSISNIVGKHHVDARDAAAVDAEGCSSKARCSRVQLLANMINFLSVVFV